MNRLMFLCCVGSLAAMASTLRADEPSNEVPETSMPSEAVEQPMLLPGAGGNSGLGKLIPDEQENDAVCGDPASGRCGGVATEEAKAEKQAKKPAEQEKPAKHDD